jgi:hypothetical protein
LAEPSWDEAESLGFRFPTPEAGWRTRVPYRTLVIDRPGHWLIQQAGLPTDRFTYELVDAGGDRSGLIWPGGEFFEPAHPEGRGGGTDRRKRPPPRGHRRVQERASVLADLLARVLALAVAAAPGVLDLFRAALS